MKFAGLNSTNNYQPIRAEYKCPGKMCDTLHMGLYRPEKCRGVQRGLFLAFLGAKGPIKAVDVLRMQVLADILKDDLVGRIYEIATREQNS